MEHKDISFEIKKEPDADGVFEGYASTFGNIDNGMDIVARGAFQKSLGKRKVRMLWQHDPNQPIGVWDIIEETERGLYVKGRISKEVQRGREAMALMRMDALDGISIGFVTKQASQEGNGSVRRLDEVDLYEISLVTFPMNEKATVTDVKSLTTEREFERFLRDAGYSRKEATAIALHGFKGLADTRDAVADEAEREGVKTLMTQINQLQETLKNG